MSIADLDQRGFINATCSHCGNQDNWLRCNKCDHADHFLFDGDAVQCACGETYRHAVCSCGKQVAPDGLRFVPFAEGPMALADLEWDWSRLALAGTILIGCVGIVWWMLF